LAPIPTPARISSYQFRRAWGGEKEKKDGREERVPTPSFSSFCVKGKKGGKKKKKRNKKEI